MNVFETWQDNPYTQTNFPASFRPMNHQQQYSEQLAMELEAYTQLEEATFAPVLQHREDCYELMSLVCEERQKVKNLIRAIRENQ